jgi:4'-phosphopantetheinyl transferase
MLLFVGEVEHARVDDSTMIAPRTIHIWLLRLEAESSKPERIALWESWLSDTERAKANAFFAERHRLDYIAAHAALRFVLGNCLGVTPAGVRFSEGTKGEKPALLKQKGRPDLRFNLSHTAGAVLIAIAWEQEIGVDVEWQRPLDDLATMVRSVMSEVEFDRWNRLPQADRERAFYHLWTRKEAYLKAIGLGLYRTLQDVTVPVSASTLFQSRHIADLSGTEVWSVQDIPVPEGYSASLCYEAAKMAQVVVVDLNTIDIR